MHLKTSSAIWRPFCLGRDELFSHVVDSIRSGWCRLSENSTCFPDVPVVSKSLFPYRSWHHPGSDFWHREKKSYKVTYRKLNVKQSRHAAIRSSHKITKRINSLGVGRCRCSNKLTHWGRDQIDAISQTTFSSAFSWMKMFQLRLKFPTEVCFQGSN